MEFPAFLRVEHEPNPSAGSRFIAEVDRGLDGAKRKFSEFSAEASRLLDTAMRMPSTKSGSLDLGVNELREAARAQQLRSAAAREVAVATATAAREAGDYSRQTRLAIAATEALAIEEAQAAQAARSHAAAVEQVQAVLSRQASVTGQAVAGTRSLTTTNSAARMGMQQLSFQLNDVATMFALGARPMQIFASQSGQVIQAVQMMTGSTRGFAGFLGGPWGLALTSAAIVITPLVAKLFETAEASKEAEFATYAFSDAQSILGGVMDLTTGRINTQSEALLALARAQAIAGRVEAMGRAAQARKDVLGLQDKEWVFGGNFMSADISRERPIQGQVSSQFLNEVITGEQAVTKLERLRDVGRITNDVFLEAAQAVANLGVETENIKVFEALEKALNGDRGAISQFLRPGRANRPRKAREDNSAERLAEFGEDAAKKLAGIRDGFANIPPEVAKVNRATRELDDLISDLQRREPEGFEELVDQAERLKELIPALGFQDAMRGLTEETERRLTLDKLALAGREEEIALLNEIWRIEGRLGPLTAEQAEEVSRVVIAREAEYKALERVHELQSAYLEATRSVRSELESLFSGEGFDVEKIARRLQAKLTVDKLFGDAFEEIDKAVKSKFDVQVDHLADGTARATGELVDLSRAFAQAAETFRNPAGASAYAGFERDFDAAFPTRTTGAANDNMDHPPLVVQGMKKAIEDSNTVLGLKPDEFWLNFGRKLVDPLLAGWEEILGPQLAGTLKGALGGAVGGYFGAGPIGAVLGGLKGLFPEGSRGSDILGAGFKGAMEGAQTDAILDSLGIKSSKTGAVLGGALAGPIGALAGGFLGGMLSSTKRGAAIIGGTGSGLGVSGYYGNSSDRKDAAGGLAGSAIDAVNRVAKALGGDVEAGRGKVSIGIREGRYVVDPQGRGYTKTSKFGDLKDFGEDAEAAVRAAAQNLIEDGVITGLRASTARLLRAGDDIEAALQEALDFEGVFKRLRAYKDPVGAALDELDDEFERLNELFKKAGASAEEYAQLEELYGIERAQAIKEATERVAGSLKSLLDDLNIGDNGLSLRDRRANALTEYDSLTARVQAGDVTAFDDYAEAARALLDIEREMFGSQGGYFDRFNEVNTIGGAAVDAQGRISEKAANRDSPFGGSAGAAQPVVDRIDWLGKYLVDELGAELGLKLNAVNQNLGALIANSGGQRGSVASVLRDQNFY